MSILLEALRKSEKNQHSPEAPNIHTDDQPGPASDSIKTGPLALLLVVALFAGGWFTWQQYQPPEGSYQPPVTLKADHTPAVIAASADSDVGGEKTAETVPAGTTPNNSASRPRTPVESFQVSRDTPPAKPARPKPANNDPVEQLAGDSKTQSAPKMAARDEPVEVAPNKRRPHISAPISYWELPDAIRADVAEIKFSVLVYSKRPAERFVLVNGQRLAEGDSPQEGLVVKEIRRDGVIFSYRLYQFLVER